MKKEMIIRAWKDPTFRASLSAEERAALPDSPSGRSMMELDEAELLEANGGRMIRPPESLDVARCVMTIWNSILSGIRGPIWCAHRTTSSRYAMS